MRQLDTCDFCGAAPDGVYEVVPAAIAGDPKRLALCADCRTTLQSVVDPLLDAAGEPTQTRTSGADQQQSATTAADAPGDSADETAAATKSDDGADTADSTDAAAAVDGTTASDAGTTASDAGTTASDAGTTASDAGTAVDDAIDAGHEGEGDAAVGSEADDSADADGVTIEPGEAVADDQAEAESRAPRPDGYAKVVRLLQNRDGAMPREDLRALATNAYDLGSREFEAAVEATIENGDVEESADGLRTV